MIVELTDAQQAEVVAVVNRKQRETEGTAQPSMARKRTPTEQRDLVLRAYAAECAVAMYLGQPWLSDDKGAKSFDVWPNIEVRNTKPGRQLFIKAREVEPGPYQKPPLTRYVLTWTGDDWHRIGLIGWMSLDEIMSGEATTYSVNDRVYGYMVRPDRLWHIERLIHVQTN